MSRKRSVSNSRSNSPPRQRRPRSPNNDSPRNQSPRKRSPPRYNQQQSGEPKVYVSGLPVNTQKEDLQQPFAKFGTVSDLFVVNKQSFAFAFVLYEDHAAAQEAISQMNGAQIKGKSIRCSIARPRPPRGNDGPRNGGGNRGGDGPRNGGNRGKGCFKCGQEGHFARECPNEEGGRQPRQGDRGSFRNKRSDEEPTASPRVVRKRSASSSGSVQKKRQGSPVRRKASPSSSGSRRRSRSRSAEMRKGKKLLDE